MITLFPNPTSSIVYLNVVWSSFYKSGIKEADFMFRVLDVSGRETIPMHQIHLSYGMLHALDVSTLSKGVYIVELKAENNVQRRELIIN